MASRKNPFQCKGLTGGRGEKGRRAGDSCQGPVVRAKGRREKGKGNNNIKNQNAKCKNDEIAASAFGLLAMTF